MVGCVAAHDGYSLTVMPPSTISQRRPSRSMASDRSRPALRMATRNPCGPSMARSDAVNASRARSAASTPLRAASPPCSGLTIVPKLSFRPHASDAAMDSARPVVSASRLMTRAAAAAAPMVPIVDVQCQPCS